MDLLTWHVTHITPPAVVAHVSMWLVALCRLLACKWTPHQPAKISNKLLWRLLLQPKRNLQSNVNRQIQDFNISTHIEDQQRVQTQYQPIQTNNQSVVVVSSDQILHQNNTPISQFSGIIPFDGSGARVVNIVANDSMPMLLGNINQPSRPIAPTIAAPMQGKPSANLL